ncbi:MAG TPA: hypothetical protein VGU27_12220 [Candidatus Eisenbacteria bacterium]|nr:hypothetical protein [Candidatus Eisenbacteria bacterium]
MRTRLPLSCLALAALVAAAPAPGRADTVTMPPPPAAPAPGGLTGVDAMTATVFESGQSSFSGVGLRARVRPGQMPAAFEVLPNIEYWRASTTVDPFGLKAVRSDATLGTDVRWTFSLSSFSPYLGTGVAVHFLSSEVDAPQLGVRHATHGLSKGGFTVLAGAAFATRERFGNFIEAKGQLVGHYQQLKIQFGISWNAH